MRGVVLKTITDYKFITTYSLDATLTIAIMDEMHFDKHTRGNSLRDKILIKNYSIKKS